MVQTVKKGWREEELYESHQKLHEYIVKWQ